MFRILWMGVLMVFLLCNLTAQEVLRGEVRVDLEPVFALQVDVPYPLDAPAAHRRALEEAALYFSAMVYGWSFYYDIGERARGIEENFELTPQGTIPFGDPGLFATDAEVRDMRLYLWTDYRLSPAQIHRLSMWRSGTIRNVQAIGHGPLGGPVETADWIGLKQAALEDAARAALRAMLRGQERNRPKEARGYICLSGFPRFWFDTGQWAVLGRFRVELTEILPFAAY
jgi:hypothetical protein